ncbi:MAG: uncharacterized protein QOH68_3875 [Nocardioidaceae bacterium]|nr:uncharacterized protein [Nocardioidaceae bacterium]
MRFRLVPVDDRFFDLFSAAASNALQASELLRELIADFNEIGTKHTKVVECERRGDELTREILHRLDTAFVPPFDREDIHALTEALDDVVDDVHHVSDLLNLLPVAAPLPELKEQAEILVEMCVATVDLLACLESMKGTNPHLENIDALESKGDAVHRRTLVRLFTGEFTALEVLKWKDVIEAMEDALNKLEDVSDIVESIVLKHA